MGDPETPAQRAWREALAQPSFRAALDAGLADLAAGRTERLEVVWDRLTTAETTPERPEVERSVTNTVKSKSLTEELWETDEEFRLGWYGDGMPNHDYRDGYLAGIRTIEHRVNGMAVVFLIAVFVIGALGFVFGLQVP